MPRVQISAVIPVRDRSGPRLDNCLRSLRWQQQLEPGAIEIVITDFGSGLGARGAIQRGPECVAEGRGQGLKPKVYRDTARFRDTGIGPQRRAQGRDGLHHGLLDQAAGLRELCERHDARLVRVDTDESWNRARALNYGIQRTTGRYVFCTDADMIFAPNFVATLLDAQARERDAAFVVCHCRDLPQRLAERTWTLEDFPELLVLAPFRTATGTGACQVARREFFERVRGYDEGFSFWGQEDNDMRARARRAGLREVWVHVQTAMLHQWHPSERGRQPLRKSLNDVRFHLTKRVTVKNWRGWGERRRPVGLG